MRRWTPALLLGSAFILASVIIVFLRSPRRSIADVIFDQISTGTTRQQVRRLMDRAPCKVSSFGLEYDRWEMEDDFTLQVDFELVSEDDYEKTPVGRVTLVELSKRPAWQDLLCRLGFWPPRTHRVKSFVE